MQEARSSSIGPIRRRGRPGETNQMSRPSVRPNRRAVPCPALVARANQGATCRCPPDGGVWPGRGHQGAGSRAAGEQGDVCVATWAGWQPPGCAHKLFSVPKLGRMALHPGRSSCHCLGWGGGDSGQPPPPPGTEMAGGPRKPPPHPVTPHLPKNRPNQLLARTWSRPGTFPGTGRE